MKQNYIIIRTIIFAAMIGIILFTSGCTENQKLNTTEPQITPPDSHAPVSTVATTTLSDLQTQNQTKSPTASSIPIFTVTPHFYGTISYGANRSSALTEDQAWKYAEAYLQTIGIQNIQSSEVVSLGQSIWNDNNTQEVVWGFQVNRMKSGANYGGIITIDAYDGHVIDYAGKL